MARGRLERSDGGPAVDPADRARETNVRVPVACTAAVWNGYVVPPARVVQVGVKVRVLMPASNEPYISIAELAARLGCSERTVWRLVERRLVPYFRPFGPPVFKWSEIERMVRTTKYAPSRRGRKSGEEADTHSDHK